VNEFRLLLRAKRLAQHPPPMWKIKLVIGIIALLVTIAAIERFVGWPDWMTLEPVGRGHIARRTQL
jgi:hypothetical protein